MLIALGCAYLKAVNQQLNKAEFPRGKRGTHTNRGEFLAQARIGQLFQPEPVS